MRKLTYLIASTLDGFVAGPDGADPTAPGGFWPITEDYVGHLVAEYPESLPFMAREALGITAEPTRFDTVIEGRRSYELGLAAGITNAYPHLRHLVCSTTLTESPDVSVEVVSDDPVTVVQKLKAEEGKGIWLVGGGDLAGSLLPEIDEVVLKLSPLTIGSGIPLFGRGASFEPASWTLSSHTVLPGGACFLTYSRA